MSTQAEPVTQFHPGRALPLAGSAGADPAPAGQPSDRNAISVSGERLPADDEQDVAALLALTVQDAVARRSGRKRRRREEQHGATPEVTYPSLATQVMAIYEGYGDKSRSEPLVKRRKHSKAGSFNTRKLRAMQSFAFRTGGCGLTTRDTRHLWELFDEWESDTPSQEGDPKKLRDFFKTPHAFHQALNDDIDAAVHDEGWFTCQLTELGESFDGYYRPALGVVLNALKQAPRVRYWARGLHGEGPLDIRETPFDADAFRLCEEQVLRDHGAAAFVLGVHAYSDSCVISSSRGKRRLAGSVLTVERIMCASGGVWCYPSKLDGGLASGS